MTAIEEQKIPLEFKTFLRKTFLAMIKELVDSETQIIIYHHNNLTIPFDYSLMLQEINYKIICRREVYKRLTGEDLECKLIFHSSEGRTSCA